MDGALDRNDAISFLRYRYFEDFRHKVGVTLEMLPCQ